MPADAAIEPGLRVGYGRDRHPFGPTSPLRLGGIEIPGAAALHGHSDGDVALHALAGALLAATGLGDLGSLFPADSRTRPGIASSDLIAEVVARLEASGWRAATVTVAIVGARPRLGGHLDSMRTAVAALLALEPGAVAIHASTGNLSGDDGAGRAISSTAVTTVVRAGARP